MIRPLPFAVATVLYGASAAHAACEEATSVTAFRLQMRAAEDAYRSLDIEAFRSSLDTTSTLLPCVSERLEEPDIARYHRLQGLLASVVGDAERAQQAFLASRALEPGFRLPLDMLPAEHPTRLEYAALPLDSVRWEPLPPPLSGSVLIDGAEQLQRPVNRPAVAQLLDEDSAVTSSTYLWPEAALAYPTATPPQRHRSRSLAIAAGGTGAAAVGLLVIASQARTAYDAEDDSLDDLDALRARTNAASGLSLGAGAVALGLGATAVAVWEW